VPELPEVETIVRGLRPRLVGLEIAEIRVFFEPIVRRLDRAALKACAGRTVLRVGRRGKMILLDCSGGLSLIFHLKMTGQLFFCPAGEPRDKHTHLAVTFENSPRELRFRDIRKFGFVLAVPTSTAGSTPELSGLGPEPLNLGFEAFRRAFVGRAGRIKARLLDQAILAGIGNIYADEILFEAGIHPEADISRLGSVSWRGLWSGARAVLRRAIRYRGTTLRDYRDGDGKRGGFQTRLRVYGREGLSCPRCRAAIRRIRVSGRSSYFCPRCQRKRTPSLV
jgi:formamidopyrimidine-DNA glycosylase